VPNFPIDSPDEAKALFLRLLRGDVAQYEQGRQEALTNRIRSFCPTLSDWHLVWGLSLEAGRGVRPRIFDNGCSRCIVKSF
jgi:hypothetical protein